MDRRTFLVAGAALAASPGVVRSQTIQRTPGQILGPFYPVVKPADSDADLTRVAGRTGRARGQVIRLSGRVLDTAGRPLRRAKVELWQADANGHYHHPSDPAPGTADPDFQGYAQLTTDDEGRYAFTSIKPAPYPDDGAGGMRAPHIHFDVVGQANRVVTQMYFPGEPLNATDRIMALAGANRSRLVAVPRDGEGAGALLFDWDIVLRGT